MSRDVLIVFGAAIRRSGKPSPVLRRRLIGAVEAAKRCREPLFLVTGGRGDGIAPEADAMWQTLREHGVAAEDILREPRSLDTLEQARRCAAILDTMPEVGRVLACTSTWHQPRCRLLLRILGVRTEAPAMPADFSGMGWRAWLYYVARELAATAWDAALLIGYRLDRRGRLPT